MARPINKMRPLKGSAEQKIEQMRKEYNVMIDELNRRLDELERKEGNQIEEKKNTIRR